MKIKEFCQKPPGELIPIPEGGHAFVPFPLPPDWEVPTGLWPLVSEADRCLGLLEGLGRTLPNPGLLLRPLSTRESIQSSRLEGTYATPKQLLLFEMNPNDSAESAIETNEWREVFNCARALEHGATSGLPLSLRLIREMHQILMEGVQGRDKTPGEFRKLQVAIGQRSAPRFVPPPPSRVMECLDQFEKYLNSQTAFHPLVDCLLAHYQFEAIHPFMDGNGRVGRLLLSLMIQRKCHLSKPWVYLSGFFESARDDYVGRLFQVSAQNDWTGWIEFGLQATISQAKDTIDRCEQLRAARAHFIARSQVIGGSIRLSQIVERLFHSPFLEIRVLAKALGVSYPTAKSDVDRLVAAGILEEMPDSRFKTYYAPEIYRIMYADIEE